MIGKGDLTWSSGGYLMSDLNDVYVFSHEKAKRRVENILANLEKYTTDLADVHGVGFCVSQEHAAFMADGFNARGIPARALTAHSSEDERRTASHVRHAGSNPVRIIWRLDTPIPAEFLRASNKLVAE